LHEPVDARDADGAEQTPIVVGIKQTSKATSTVIEKSRSGRWPNAFIDMSTIRKMIVRAESRR